MTSTQNQPRLSAAQVKMMREINHRGFTHGYGAGWKTLDKLITLGLVERGETGGTQWNDFPETGYIFTAAGQAWSDADYIENYDLTTRTYR